MNSSHSGEVSSPVRVTVKWFNVVKGFGFVSPEDGSEDIFLHLTILKEAGRDRVSPGASLEVEVASGEKGLQVSRVLSVDESTSAPETFSPKRRRSDKSMSNGDEAPAGDYVRGVVKWFSGSKGYGFVSPDGADSVDVFLHMVTLRKSGINELAPGQNIEFCYTDGPKGKQATGVRLVGD
jgi:CspA family cold shock protein